MARSIDAPDPLIGTLIGGKYRIEEVLDEGGFAVVYRAEQVDIARAVAVKVLRDGLGTAEDIQARFEREARVLASLTHPNIVSLVDYGVSEGLPYLVMELLPGRTLKDDIARGPLPPSRALAIAKQILRAVAFAHGAKVLHRDLKPANVFLQVLPDTPDHVKILDFGFAKLVTPEAAEKDQRRLTRTGQAFGTPAYVAPEQVTEGGTIDARADVYAVGLILFEMLAGRKPFTGDAAEQVRAKLTRDPPLLSEVATSLYVSAELDQLLVRALSRAQDARFGCASAMLDALEALPSDAARLRTEPPPPARADAVIAVPRAGAVPSLTPPPPGEPTPPATHGAPIVPILLGIIALLLVIILVGGGVLVYALVGRAEPDAPEAMRATGEAAAGPAQAAAPASSPDDDAARIADVEERLARGEAIGDETVRALRDQLGRAPTDARPHVLIGHIYVARAWHSDAIDHYERAFSVDRGACEDPLMIANLVVLARSTPRVARRASTLLERAYGADALPAVEQALRDEELDAAGRRALEQLRDRLGRAH